MSHTMPGMDKTPATKAKIETLATSSLIPYARNSRTHSEVQVGQIAASIREFGFTSPVLIDKDNTIIAGHGRVLAAQKLGLETVPCIRLAHLTPSQVRAYVIADNRLVETSTWDEKMLATELHALREGDFDLSLTGFDGAAIERFLTDAEAIVDPSAEWKGMPEFEHEDLTAHRKIIVNFASDADVEDFARKIGQPITEKARSIWHPKAEIGHFADKRYVADDSVAGEPRELGEEG
jgi:ParB-like chromosome segregation protein Spo0J